MLNQITIPQLLEALYRQRYTAIVVWSLVMVIAVAGFLIWPRKYGSEGKMYVRVGRVATAISPAGGSGAVSVQDTRETEVRSVVEIINSRAVIESVVDELGADRILASPFDAWVPSISLPLPDFGGAGGDDFAADEYKRLKKREIAARALEDAIKIYAQKKTSVISVYARANSAELAREIVRSFFKHTRRIHLNIHAVDGSTQFFDEQFVEQENTVVQAVKLLADFRNGHNVLSIDAARGTLQQIIGKLENEVLDAEVQVEQMAKRMASLRIGIASTAKQLAIPTSNKESKAFEDSKHTVFQLEAERERLVSTYSTIHPEVKRIDNQLKKVRQSLAAMSDGRTESSMASNPIYEELKVEMVRAEAGYAGAVARLSSLKQKQAGNKLKLRQMNDAEVRSDQLRRDVDIARQELAIYSQRRGEAKAMSIMDKRGISDIVTAQTPTLNVKRVSPKGSVFLPVGAFFGTLLALAVALFFERNHLFPALKKNAVERPLKSPDFVTLPCVDSNYNVAK